MLRTEEAAPAGLLLEAAAECTAAVPLLRAAEGSMAAVPFMQEEAASMWAAPVMTMDIIAGALFTGVGQRMLAEEAFTAGVPLWRAAEAALLEGGVTLDALAVCGAGRLSRV